MSTPRIPSLIPVLPVAKFDWHLAVKLLRWQKVLSDGDPQPLVIIHSPDLTAREVWRLNDCVPSASKIVRADVKENGYFGGTPNAMFLFALEYVEKAYPGHPMLWIEADCVPITPDWFEKVSAEYDECGKPFMGDIVRGAIDHMTGVAVYPPNWRELAPSLALLNSKEGFNTMVGWDSQCAGEVVPQASQSKTIRQVWRPPTFIKENWRDIVPEGCALFHQCKDASLIDVLCDEAGSPHIPIDDRIAVSTYDSTKPSVIEDPRVPRPLPLRALNIEMLFVTFKRDMEFLRYTLMSAKKYAKGFTGITLAVPSSEKGLYDWTNGIAKVVYFDETPGKGMLHHEIMVCRADELCPTADAILHLDADFCLWRPFTPEDAAPNGCPLMVRERYSECGKRNPNRLVWQGVVAAAIGWRPEWETMVRHPQVHIREVYKITRGLVEEHTKKPFDEYVLSCQEAFPQGFCEYNTIGAVAARYFPGAYTMVDYDHAKDGKDHQLPEGSNYQYIYDRKRDMGAEVWSHGGIKRYEADLRNWLNGQIPAYWVK